MILNLPEERYDELCSKSHISDEEDKFCKGDIETLEFVESI